MSRPSPVVLVLLAFVTGCSPTDRGARSKSSAITPALYTVADFYKNSEFRGASWSPDNQKLLVSSNLSGIWNAFAVPRAGGAPQPLTNSTTNSIFALSYFPKDERLLYSSDQGGNELTHIYLRN